MEPNEQRLCGPKGFLATAGGAMFVGNVWIGDENTGVYYQ